MKRFTRSARRLRMLERARGKKMSFAVYGASQAGKSYLANALAKGPKERLLLRVGDDELRFDDQVNPAGGQESTGLVTRLTLDKTAIRNSGYPIRLRLLALTDIVKLIFNTFANDLVDDGDSELEYHVKVINDKMQAIENRVGIASMRSLDPKSVTKDSLYDIEDYCRGKFKQHLYVQALNRADFWTRQEALLQDGKFDAIQQSIHLLWMDLARYNELFEVLLGGLQTLGYSEEVFCPLESLVETTDQGRRRKKKSIINVQVLQDLDDGAEPASSVLLADDRVARIRPSVLSALTAEIEFTISPPTHDFFQTADLLDFPGARSRKQQMLSGFRNAKGLPIEEYNRGKVAFLFDKYVSEFEISGMLLCVEGGPQEIVGLDALIDEWIEESHGAKPSARNGVPCTLFFVLTKFDQLFVSAHGVDDGPGRWEARLHSSLEEPFGGQKRSPKTNWVQQWNDRGAFRNTFWLRNPSFDFSSMVNYSGDPGKSLELEFRPEKQKMLDTLRSSFLASSVAGKYFENPSKAWDEGCRLNDGGVSYILGQVTRVASREIRDEQLRNLIVLELANRRDDISPFLVAANEDEMRAQKQELAKTLIRRFNMLLLRDKLGEFVALLLLREQQVRVFLERAKRERERAKMTSRRGDDADVDGNDVPIDPFLANILGEAPPPAARVTVPDENKDRTYYRNAVREFVDAWIDGLAETICRREVLNYLYLDRAVFVSFCAELKQAILNQKLEELAELVYLKAQVKTGTEQQRMWQQVSQFTAIMNDFIAFGTVDGRTPSEVPLPDGRTVKVFAQAKSTSIEIKEEPDLYSLHFWRDWIVAMQSAAIRNLTLPGLDGKRLAENTALKQLLNRYMDEMRTLEGKA